MKTLFILLSSFLIGNTLFSQAGTVTINVAGNRITQIAVDDQYYTVNNSAATGKKIFTISSLNTGQHKLEIVRRSQTYNAATNSINTTFNLRDGYNLTLTISSTGAVSSTEQWIGNNNTGKAISTANYNKLYTQVKNKTSSQSRSTLLESEFTNTNKLFTSTQASSLIKLVNSESLRFKLAKLSYTRITDRQNFSLVSSLLNSTSNRNELNTYIASLPDEDNDDTDNGDASTPMNNAKFRTIYNEVLAETSNTDKNYYLSNFFSKDFNYYTSSQARQLIQLITTEPERFYLAKIAYRGITDRTIYYNQVAPLLNSSYDRSELTTYINSYNNNNSDVRTGMSATNFDNLYKTIYYQNTASARYTSINNAFATSGYYFTVAQAKQMIQLVNDENSRLLLSKASYKTLVDRNNYTQFYDLLNSTASRNDLNNYVLNYDNNNGTGGGSVGVAMSDAEYNRLYNNVNSAWSTSTRFNLVSEGFNTGSNYFTVYQVRQLLSLISSETDRLSLAKSSYDNIVDKANYTQLYDLFTNSTYKNELANFYAQAQYGGVGTVTRIPVSEAEFNSTLRDIQFTFGLGAKMSSLVKIFNNETKYYTVAQTRQLIQLVSSESNRLELSKLAYNNMTDPGNYTQLLDIFSTQASKDEFTAYVNSNAYLNQ